MERLTGTLSGVSRINGTLVGSASVEAELTAPETLTGTLSGIGRMTGTLTGMKTIEAELISAGGGGEIVPYTGEYIYTPTRETQTVPIGGMKALQNITINPIPQNYGLITWNGSALTVS